MDTELAYTPVTQAYGHSYESQYIVSTCCTAAGAGEGGSPWVKLMGLDMFVRSVGEGGWGRTKWSLTPTIPALDVHGRT